MSEQNIKQICHDALKLYLLNSQEQFIQWIFRTYVEEQSRISFNFINENFPEYIQNIPDEKGRRKNIIKIFNFFLDYYDTHAKKRYKRSSPRPAPPIAGFYKLKARIPDFEKKIKKAGAESRKITEKWNRMLGEQKNSGERGTLFKEYERSIDETLEFVEKLLKTSQKLRENMEIARNAAAQALMGGGKKKQTGGDKWILLYAIGTLLCFILCWQINKNIKSSILRHERIVNFNINKFKKEVLSSFPSMIDQIGEMQSNPMSCNYIKDTPQTFISHEGEEKNPTGMPDEMTNIQRNMKTGTQTKKGTEQPVVEEYTAADEAITPEMLEEDRAEQEQEVATLKSFLEGEAGAVSLFNVRVLTDAYKCWGTNVMQAGFRDLKKHGNDIMEATRAPDDIIRNDEFENAVEHVAEAGMAYVYPGASFAHHTGNVVTEATGGLTEGAAKLAAAAVSFERATTLIKTLTNEGKGVVWDLFKYGKFFIISEHVGLTLLSAGLEQYRGANRLEIVPFNFQPQHPGLRRGMQAARHNIASLLFSSMWRSGLYTLDNHLIPSINYMYRILHAPPVQGAGYPTREEYGMEGTGTVVLDRDDSAGGSALGRVRDEAERERALADNWHGTGYVAEEGERNYDSYGDLGGGRKKTRKRRKKKSRKKKMKRKKKSRKKRKKKKTRKRRRKH